jgi:hypothetical protein
VCREKKRYFYVFIRKKIKKNNKQIKTPLKPNGIKGYSKFDLNFSMLKFFSKMLKF